MNMNIFKVSKFFNASIRTKTSKAGKEYDACSICQSVKKQDGSYEKVYMNGFVEDLMHLKLVVDSALNEYATIKGNEVKAKFGKSEGSQQVERKQETESSDIDDEIPF